MSGERDQLQEDDQSFEDLSTNQGDLRSYRGDVLKPDMYFKPDTSNIAT